MLGILVVTLMSVSILFGIKNDTLGQVSAAAIDSCSKAVELTITLAGSMALWGGIMSVAERCKITDFFQRLISPVTKRLFKGLENNPKAAKQISMNLTANLLGLGNASTPLGIAAVKSLNSQGDCHAKRNTAMLVVLNTASIQLLPTTVGAIRLSHGSVNPFDITLPVLVTSLSAAAAGCIMVYALYLTERKNEHK